MRHSGSNDIETDQRFAMCKVSRSPQKGESFGIILPPAAANRRFRVCLGPTMKSSALKRSLVIGGRKTSVSLEEPFWRDLKEIADSQGETLSNIVTTIDRTKKQNNLSSAIRLFVLEQIKNRKSGATRV
jgi:predicted DNA-binding ribbon-helix-helix protein